MKILRILTSFILYQLIKGQLKHMGDNGYEVVGVSGLPEERANEASVRKGIKTVITPRLVRSISISSDIRALFELIKLIRGEKPDVVHANTPKASLLGITAAWWCRVPHRIYTVTGLRFQTAKGSFRWLLITMECITCHFSTKVIPEGDGVARTLLDEHITRKPPKKLHNGNVNGIDLAYYDENATPISLLSQAKSETGFSEESFAFIFVGWIVRDKGVCELVEVFTRLQQEHPRARLLLVGNFEQELDPLPKDVYHTIQSHSAIYCAGWQNDVRLWFAVAGTLAFSPYQEGFPNIVMQAGAMGLPCITSDINGCNEIIIEGENGLIIPSHDAVALYQTMKRMIKGKALYTHCQQNARPLTAPRYKQEDVWQATLGMYRSLTGDAK